jgi:ribosomal protein S18 acetylase RimI-like enzyme
MIRPFHEADRARIHEITATCFVGVAMDHTLEQRYGRIGGATWQQRKQRDLNAELDANPRGAFVAEEDGAVVGYITTRLNPSTKIGGIPNLAVLPGQQGKGLGRALLQTALDYLTNEGMQLARIETLEQNAVGRHLYPQLGFQEFARQIQFVMPLKACGKP